MSQKNKLRTGMLIGAVVGGLVALLDKNTRQMTANNCRSCFNKVKNFVSEPTIVLDKVKAKTSQARDTVSQITDDIVFITEKAQELQDITPQVANFVKETKDVFVDRNEEKADL